MVSEIQQWYRSGVPTENQVPRTVADEDWCIFARHVNDGESIARLADVRGVTVATMRSTILRVVRAWNHQLARHRLPGDIHGHGVTRDRSYD